MSKPDIAEVASDQSGDCFWLEITLKGYGQIVVPVAHLQDYETICRRCQKMFGVLFDPMPNAAWVALVDEASCLLFRGIGLKN